MKQAKFGYLLDTNDFFATRADDDFRFPRFLEARPENAVDPGFVRTGPGWTTEGLENDCSEDRATGRWVDAYFKPRPHEFEFVNLGLYAEAQPYFSPMHPPPPPCDARFLPSSPRDELAAARAWLRPDVAHGTLAPGALRSTGDVVGWSQPLRFALMAKAESHWTSHGAARAGVDVLPPEASFVPLNLKATCLESWRQPVGLPGPRPGRAPGQPATPPGSVARVAAAGMQRQLERLTLVHGISPWSAHAAAPGNGLEYLNLGSWHPPASVARTEHNALVAGYLALAAAPPEARPAPVPAPRLSPALTPTLSPTASPTASATSSAESTASPTPPSTPAPPHSVADVARLLGQVHDEMLRFPEALSQRLEAAQRASTPAPEQARAPVPVPAEMQAMAAKLRALEAQVAALEALASAPRTQPGPEPVPAPQQVPSITVTATAAPAGTRAKAPAPAAGAAASAPAPAVTATATVNVPAAGARFNRRRDEALLSRWLPEPIARLASRPPWAYLADAVREPSWRNVLLAPPMTLLSAALHVLDALAAVIAYFHSNGMFALLNIALTIYLRALRVV